MSYEQIKALRPALFKRYCGVKPETFHKMVEVVSLHLARTRIKPGRPPKLAVADQVLMTLEYWREYRTFFHIAKSWGIHESSVCRIIKRVEDILTKSKAFNLPGKKKLQMSDHQIEFIVVDVAETPIERPKKSKNAITAARRSDTP
jgi:DDE superfamily endonuclease